MTDTQPQPGTAAQRQARTLTAGNRLLVQRLAGRATAWVRAGRREDLEGIAAALGPIVRTAVLAAGLYVGWRVIRHWPALLWALVPLWIWAAVRAIPDEAPDAAEVSTEQREQLHALIRDLVGDRPGVHLSTLLDHLQKHGQGEGWTVAILRTRLPLLGVPVRRSVKVARRVAYGVHRDDLPQAFPAEGEQQAA
ncbi:hypothetical protein ACIRJR_09445 [Streptomyces sp. NPDC102402]|uniref:hypothetical protein n=1 Tax=Streptomyces sp. NPDC102402 TaxID=3366169 RepID=UPI00382EB122